MSTANQKRADSLAERRAMLERVYQTYTRPEFIAPDPVQVVRRYTTDEDREVAGLLASALAYGHVKQILKNLNWVMERMTDAPARYLRENRPGTLARAFRGFRHRWTTDRELVDLLLGMREALRTYGSLQACFLAGDDPDEEHVGGALSAFVARLRAGGGEEPNSLLPRPERGSACKRLHLYLRWMVRRDAVDVGAWPKVSSARLLVPLDTHLYRMARALGMTRRKQVNLKTVLEVTAAFRQVHPGDPVRYDFALTRLGIRRMGALAPFLHPGDEKAAKTAADSSLGGQD